MPIKEVDGDLIKLALSGSFDVICHGVNCFCTMGAGIAPQMAKAFGCDKFDLEAQKYKGDINKLGQIDYRIFMREIEHVEVFSSNLDEFEQGDLIVVNAYTQYHYGANHKDGVKAPLDYDALSLCFKKINYVFKGKHLGIPKIGAGLAGGNWTMIKEIIELYTPDINITVVNYTP